MLTQKQHKRLKEEYLELLRSVNRPGIEELISYLEENNFFRGPATCEHGCSVPGGLLVHSLNVYKALKEKLAIGSSSVWASVSMDANITDETIVIVALLHALHKIGAYEVTQKNVKNYDATAVAAAKTHERKKDDAGEYIWEVKTGYKKTNRNPLGGAGETSVITAMRFIKLTETEILALRWHAGYAAEEYAARVSDAFAATPLALALYQADLEATFLLDIAAQ